MESNNYRKGAKSKLRLSTRRRKPSNIAKFNRSRQIGLPCLTKDITSAANTSDRENTTTHSASQQSNGANEMIITDMKVCSNIDIINCDTGSPEGPPSEGFPKQQKRKRETTLDGYRVVNIQYFINSLRSLSNHSPLLGCSLTNMHIVKEFKIGFESKITFQCDMCNYTKTISTCPQHPHKVDINTSAVTAIMNTGGGYTQLKNIVGAMDIPPLSFSLYKRVHTEISNAWQEMAWSSMKEAAEEERKMALESGSVDVNGTPMITVICDGSWAKRSYRGGGNYNSLSGTAAIIGKKSGKILYLGVKNKYCCVCQRSKNKGEEPASHTCYKNWNLSSTAMEASIIAEGFCSSLLMYQLIYNKMIADGDSSCYKKILDSRPYETCTVQKIECTNHLLRNYSNKLRELSKSKGVPGALKNVISNNILRCRAAITKAVQYRKREEALTEEEKIKNLKKDIINSVSHIFGEHKSCSELKYFCQKTDPDNNNYISDFEAFGVRDKLMDAVRYLAGHSRSLIENVNTNVVEQFNAIIAQKVGGKRINYSLRRCYQSRCFSAVVAKNTRRPLYNIHKLLTGGHSPSKILKKTEDSAIKKHTKRRQCRRKLSFPSAPDRDYGDNCQKPDLHEKLFEDSKADFLNKLNQSPEEYREIEIKTRLQADSTEWKHYRKKLLTSSVFGQVCKMRSTTSCTSIVTSVLYKEFVTKATIWGRTNEDRAKRELEGRFEFDIVDCGLFINKNWPFLGASPDGIETRSGYLVEIKCPFSARNCTIKEAIEKKYLSYLEVDGKNYKLKKTHSYYYQIQGQLNIAEKEKCYFSVWTSKDLIYIEIPVDKDFFKKSMLPKLSKFYYHCLLPEIIDPRHTRGMKIRDPIYITDAQKVKNSKITPEK